MTNRKSYYELSIGTKIGDFELNDFKWRNGRYIALFHSIW